MTRRLKMNGEKSKRNLCESENSRNVALKNCGEYRRNQTNRLAW